MLRRGAHMGQLAVILFWLPATLLARDLSLIAPVNKWTSTDPPINLAHIDFGEINRHGEAVGYHHRANGSDPPGARVLEIVQAPDASGIYRARVAIRDPASGAWIRKGIPSTFYPDTMSDAEIVDAILAAFHDGARRSNGRFIGSSGRGFMIEGWHQNGRINAAYPLRGP
jgi:Bacterial EndoU nuclease